MRRLDREERLTALAAAQGLVGGVLLAVPDPVLAAIGSGPPGRPARIFARLLGARQLLEAVVLWRRPTREAARACAVVDALHGASTLWLVARGDDRRLAAVNAASATAFAVAGWYVADRL